MPLHNLCDQEFPIRLKNKIVIIINGKGGTGKDTVCKISSKFFKVKVISAIDPIKKIAFSVGWDGKKDLKARKFLSDLKKLLIDFNNYPTNYLEEEYRKFLEEDTDILFVHIREGNQIDALKERIHTACATMLIQRPLCNCNAALFGNDSDDNVNEYSYDYCYNNCCSLELLEDDFKNFLYSLLMSEGVLDKSVNGTGEG